MKHSTFLKFFTTVFLSFLFSLSYSQCSYSISMTDDYGDGWQGGSITVLVNGTAVLTDITLSDGHGPELQGFLVTVGDDITTSFTAGAWVQEVGYEILDSEGNSVFSAHGSGGGNSVTPPDNVTSGTINIVCPTCPAPYNLNATSVDEVSANLIWEESGSASSWNIEWGTSSFTLGSGTQINNLSVTNYSLTGLSQSTAYDFYVQSDCGSEQSSWSGPYSFTTVTPPFNNPTDCDVNIPIQPGYSNCLEAYIQVQDLYGTQLGTDVTVDKFNIILEHPDLSKVSMYLESPNHVQTKICYWNASGENMGIIDGTCTQYTSFSMAAPDGPINFATAPYIGEYSPDEDFNQWEDGSNPNGIWHLRVCVDPGAPVGTFHYAEIEFNDMGAPQADIVINELDCDQTSDTLEFVELYDGGVGNILLDGYTVAFYNGSSNQIYNVFDLDGYSTDANGYFVLGNTAVTQASLTFPNGNLQDGADAVALYTDDATNLPVGTAVTTTNLVDALVYGTGDATDNDLLPLLNTGQPQVDEDELGHKKQNSCSRLPNGSGGFRNTDTYSAAIPTPGAENRGVPQLIYSNTEFTEALANNGSIENTIVAKLENETFASIGLLTENTDYTVTNVPAGLSFGVEVLTDTTAELSLSGQADSHTELDDISNLNVSFTDAAYTNNSASMVINNSTDLSVNFFDTPPATLLWSSDTLYEDTIADDGSINTSIDLELISESFTTSSGEIFAYTSNNVPSGLSVQIIATDATHATLTLIGNADNHNLVDDINNMEINFTDLAFSGGNASAVNGYSKNNISVSYYEFFNTGTDIISYSFAEQTGPAVIDNVNHTVNIEVANGTNVYNLIATFALSTAATAYVNLNEQISGTSPNNFGLPVTYHVVAEDGVTNQDWTVIVDVSTKIDKLNTKNYISVYPNPAQKFVIIDSKNLNIEDYKVYDLTGKLMGVYRTPNSKIRISTEKWESGVYWIKITTDKETINKKLIIK